MTNDASPNLPALLKDFESYGGLAVNWQLYGSNGFEKRPKGVKGLILNIAAGCVIAGQWLSRNLLDPDVAVMASCKGYRMRLRQLHTICGLCYYYGFKSYCFMMPLSVTDWCLQLGLPNRRRRPGQLHSLHAQGLRREPNGQDHRQHTGEFI